MVLALWANSAQRNAFLRHSFGSPATAELPLQTGGSATGLSATDAWDGATVGDGMTLDHLQAQVEFETIRTVNG